MTTHRSLRSAPGAPPDPTLPFDACVAWVRAQARGDVSVARHELPEDALAQAWTRASAADRPRLSRAFATALADAAREPHGDAEIAALAALAARTELTLALPTLRSLADRTALGDGSLGEQAQSAVLHALAALQPRDGLLVALWTRLFLLGHPWLLGLALTALGRSDPARALALIPDAVRRERDTPFGLGEALWALANEPAIGRARLGRALVALSPALRAVAEQELREVGGEAVLAGAGARPRRARKSTTRAASPWFAARPSVVAPPRLGA